MGEYGDEWAFDRIGTEREKMQVEKELQDLRERLSQVDKWKARRAEIESELAKVWVEGGEDLSAPSYVKEEEATPAAQ
jgi:ATP-binding cassette subfamily D (ALD) long-chain fatty acid import protein